MAKKMTHAPVYYVLTQVRFNAVLTLEQYVPAIQERMRKAGYTDYERVVLAAINMNPAFGQGQGLPAIQQQTQFQFLNADRTAGFILEQSGISYQTTEYDTFETFSRAFIDGLSIVHEVASLEYSERVGIRFLDAVWPSSGESLEQYLTPTILGLMGKLEPRKLAHSISETRTRLDRTTLVSRSVIYEQEQEGAAFPPELQPVVLKPTERFRKVKGLYCVIDTDSFAEEREKFDIEKLEKRLRYLQQDVRRSFDCMVTPYALKVWE
jgi:uncharacterized protein (TIGR04255 family)